HLGYLVRLTEELETQFFSPQQLSWLDRLETEHNNIRAALAWSISTENVEAGLRLAGAVGWFWYIRVHHREAHDWLAQLLATDENVPTQVRVKALIRGAEIEFVLGDLERGNALAEEALQLSRGAQDKLSIAWALAALGLVADGVGRDAIPVLEQAEAVF